MICMLSVLQPGVWFYFVNFYHKRISRCSHLDCTDSTFKLSLHPVLDSTRLSAYSISKRCYTSCRTVRRGAHLMPLSPWDSIPQSATHRESDARPTVTFPVAEHRRPWPVLLCRPANGISSKRGRCTAYIRPTLLL